MAYKAGLLDRDLPYQKALTEYLNLRTSTPIQLYTFTTEQVLQQFLEREKLELLLLGDEFEDWDGCCQTIVLTTQRERVDGVRFLFRYQNVDVLLNAITDRLQEKTNAPELADAFVAVYSPLGRCGKTMFSHRLCEKFENGLYVNWEGFSAQERKDTFGNWLLYCIISRNPECFSYMKEHALSDISPPEMIVEMRQIGYDDLKWFRDTIKSLKLYDGVVVDIGTMVICEWKMLQLFDRVYVPVLEDDISRKKIEEFERMYHQECGRDVSVQYLCVDQEMERYLR